MSVTKSRRTAGWILVAALVVTVVLAILYFVGGTNYEEVANYKAYNYTNILLGWTYFILGLTILVTFLFGIIGFFQSFKKDSKSALRGLVGLILLIVLLVITYMLGNGDPNSLSMLSDDANKYMTPFWLKVSDMVLYTAYILLVATIVALIWGAIRASLNRSKNKENTITKNVNSTSLRG